MDKQIIKKRKGALYPTNFKDISIGEYFIGLDNDNNDIYMKISKKEAISLYTGEIRDFFWTIIKVKKVKIKVYFGGE